MNDQKNGGVVNKEANIFSTVLYNIYMSMICLVFD